MASVSYLPSDQFQFTPLREGRRRRPSSRRWCWMHFNSRPSARGDKSAKAALQPLAYFNSRPSARGDYIVPSPCCQGAISIHAPPRGATCPRRTTPSPRRYFNSRPSARGDARIPAPRCECANFNSRPSARGDTIRCSPWQCPAISIHAPPRGATFAMQIASDVLPFQFTPLREGRPVQSYQYTDAAKISIHAPPRGATFLLCCTRGRHFISIHAPPRGATVHGVCWGYWNLISIHAPPRGATTGHCHGEHRSLISIHAPPRGATKRAVHAGVSDAISIHAPPRGATDTPPEQLEVHRQFQFTPLREGRHDDGTRVLKSYLFHIHAPPRGATVGCAQGVEQIHISIHAPPRGATGTRRICGTRSANFNSRPSARGDLRISAHTVSRKISIHAPPRGATVKDSGFKKHLYFNSRPSARGDQAWRSTFRRTYNFNSRPSARGDTSTIS